MQATNIRHLIPIVEHNGVPKYVQVSNGVIKAIEERRLIKGDALPSLRQLSDQLNISFDTAKKAYDVLKKKNIVVAAQGKSNVVNATGPIPLFRIFLLFNKLGSHKRVMYDSFKESFRYPAQIDLQVYNNDLQLFRHLIGTRKQTYTHYVIIPHLAEGAEKIREIIEEHLPGEKLVLLDKKVDGINIPHASVHEDFENDIYHALEKALPSLSRYTSLVLVFPEENYYPREILDGFKKFSRDYSFQYSTSTGVPEQLPVARGQVYISLSDEDLCRLIRKIKSLHLVIGRDVGIISYNETPLKEVLLEGITTMSTDFRLMGKLAADKVMEHSTGHVPVPFQLILRKSL